MKTRNLDKKSIISFILASFCMMMVLWNMGVLWNGENSLIEGDLMENYIPAIKNLCRDIINRESIWYSWNMGMGMNTALYNAYYAFNPFNILYLIFYNSYDNAVTIAIVVIKTGLSALCFHLFISEAHDVKSPWSIIFSISYAMCAFQISYNIVNIIWLDAMFILPVVFLGIKRLFEDGEYRLLLFGYSYIFIFQFYMGYMIGIFSFSYFVFRIIAELQSDKEAKLGVLTFRYIFIVLIAVGLSSFVWLPTVCFIIHNQPTDASTFQSLELTLHDFLSQFVWRRIVGSYTELPNLYCGLATVILFPCFLISSKVRLKEKVIYVCMLLGLVVSCFVPWLYKMWHGFDAPDGWSYRFAYMISFLMCTMAAIIANIYDVNRMILKILIVVIVMTELISAYWNQPILKNRLSKQEYDLWNVSEKENLVSLGEDTDFYRVNTLNNYSINPGIYYGYNGISYFSTAENPRVRETLSKLGLYSSPRMLLNFGLTPVTEMLLDVKYDTYGAMLIENGTEQDLYSTIIGNDSVLGIGYMVGGKPQDYHLTTKNAFENSNKLLSLMSGIDGVYERVSDADIEKEEYAVRLAKSKNGYEIETDHPDVRVEDAHMSFSVSANDNEQIYAYIENDTSIKSEQGFVMEGGYENVVRSMGNVAVSYIKPLKQEDGQYKLTITPIGDVKSQPIDDIYFYKLNKQKFEDAYKSLSEGKINILDYNDGYLKGIIRSECENGLLFLTIPCENGWSAKVDGKNVRIQPLLNDTFIGLVIPEEGEHTVELRYSAQGADWGIFIAIVSFIAVIIMEKKYTNKMARGLDKTENGCER